MNHVETAFRLLASQRRIMALTVLEEYGPMQLSELACSIAAREAGTTRDAVQAPHCHKVETTLRHVHLPKLQDHGAVVHDGADVRLAGGADEVLSLLQAAFDASIVSS